MLSEAKRGGRRVGQHARLSYGWKEQHNRTQRWRMTPSKSHELNTKSMKFSIKLSIIPWPSHSIAPRSPAHPWDIEVHFISFSFTANLSPKVPTASFIRTWIRVINLELSETISRLWVMEKGNIGRLTKHSAMGEFSSVPCS